MNVDKKVLRILDANFNRSREGLRVCEEIFRFFLSDPLIMRKLKQARHEITRILKSASFPRASLLAARDVGADKGKSPSLLENERSGILDLFSANIERTKESLRVLEEFSKALDPKIAFEFKKLRFEIYAIEKRALPKLESLRDCR